MVDLSVQAFQNRKAATHITPLPEIAAVQVVLVQQLT
jgi:hypothetical protein